MAEITDEELAQNVQRGEVKAFDELMRRYERKITRYARRFLFSGDDAKDIVQDVFVKTYVNIKSFNTGKKFSPWIYRIAHNEFINAIRKKKSEKVFSFDFDLLFPHPAAKETADKEANNNDLKRQLDTCLNQLPAKYREPLTLYFYEDLDYKEIAEVLRIPVSTVGVRIQRGKNILRNLVEKVEA